ncbi:tetratricopeptide repeat protein [Nitrospina watsonii]|nr:tetratricopeptide repeat protein [Nitrospina watsonii]
MTSFTGDAGGIASNLRQRLAALTLVLLLLPACGPSSQTAHVSDTAINSFLQNKPAGLHLLYRKALMEGPRNQVLNDMRVGLAAMELGHYSLARDALDRALLNIETIYADDATARNARSLWYEEGKKDFKGEPYERAMAYYYRGLLYILEGDFENARASFKGGVLQDAFAEEEQNRCDFALLIFLQGWVSDKMGDRDLARMAYEEVKRLRPDFQLPDPGHNVLVIVETGTSPRKVSDGIGHGELKFRRGRGFVESRAHLKLNGSTYDAYPMEDIYWQATSRGGRQFDKILEGKVHFRQTNAMVGSALTDIAAKTMIMAPLMENSGSFQIAAGALGLVGATQMALAANTKTQADTRYWNNLPDGVHVFTARVEPAQWGDVEIVFEDATQRPQPGLSQQRPILKTHGGTGLVWARSRSALNVK